MISYIKKVPKILIFYFILLIVHYSSLFLFPTTYKKDKIKIINGYVTIVDSKTNEVKICTSLSSVYDIKDGYMYSVESNFGEIINIFLPIIALVIPFMFIDISNDFINRTFNKFEKLTNLDFKYIYADDLISGNQSNLNYEIRMNVEEDETYTYDSPKNRINGDKNISFSLSKNETLIINLELIDGEEIIKI